MANGDESNTDELNMAIQSLLADGDDADRLPSDEDDNEKPENEQPEHDDGDDEISATPVMQTHSHKRDRTKLASANKPTRKSCVKSEQKPPSVKVEQPAASPSAGIINGSPLRERNRATVKRVATGNKPRPASVDDASLGFVDVRAERRSKDSVRKVLTLSSSSKASPTTATSPRLRQSVLSFKPTPTKDRKPPKPFRMNDVSHTC